MFITIYLIKCLYSLQYTHKYLAGKSVMKEDAVPVRKVDLHHCVSLRAFAMTYSTACGFRDWSPNQSRVFFWGCLLAEILICIIVGLDQQSLVHKNVWAKDVDRSLQLYEEPSWRFPIAPMASRDSVPISLGNDGEMTRKGIYFSNVLQQYQISGCFQIPTSKDLNQFPWLDWSIRIFSCAGTHIWLNPMFNELLEESVWTCQGPRFKLSYDVTSVSSHELEVGETF